MTKTFLLLILALVLGACSEQPQVLAHIEGSDTGDAFDVHATMLSPVGDAGGVMGSAAALLPVLPSMGFGTGGVPTGASYVALVQGVRVTETAWDRTNCGRVPASGVCVAITMQNMYTVQRLTQAYVEFTSLTPTAPTTNVTFRSNATSNASLGTSSAIGLMRYPNLAVAGAAGDRAVRYWVFRSTDPGPARFHFAADVKGTLR
jgi:hypothetical protein